MSAGNAAKSLVHDDDVERAVLATILLQPRLADEVAIRLSSEDFFSERNRLIFSAIRCLARAGKTADLPVVKAELRKLGTLERCGGPAYVTALVDGMPQSGDLDSYAASLKELAMRRGLVRIAADLEAEASHGLSDPREIRSESLARLQSLGAGQYSRDVLQTLTLAEIIKDPSALAPPEVVLPGLAWSGRVTMLAAREKDGKSTLVGAAAAQVSRGGLWLDAVVESGEVLWLGLEEHVSDISTRLVNHRAEPQRVHICLPRGGLGQRLENLLALAEQLRPRLIVIDTLATLAGELESIPDPGSSSGWTTLMSAIARISRITGAAIVVVHHSRKSDGKYRDSSAIGAGVDAILEMSSVGMDANVRRISAKARWQVDDYKVRLTDGGFELEGAVSLDVRVLRFIADHPGCSMTMIREGVTGKNTDIATAVAALVESGAVRVERSGNIRHHYLACSPVRSPAEERSRSQVPFPPRSSGDSTGDGLLVPAPQP